MLKQIGLAALTLIMALMAGLQLNDPDPAYWLMTYLMAGLVSLLALLNKSLATVSPLAAGLVLAGLLIAGPGFVDFLVSRDYGSLTGAMSDNKPYVESAREFIGLLIAAMAIVLARKRQ